MFNINLDPYFMEFLNTESLIYFCSLKQKYINIFKIYDLYDKNGYGFEFSCNTGNEELVQFFIEREEEYEWDFGIEIATLYNHKNIIDILIKYESECIEKERDECDYEERDIWDWGMVCAAKNGLRDLVELFIKKGGYDWNLGIMYAAINSHKDLIDFFIEKGANNWNHGMFGAILGCHKDLIDFFIEKGANNFDEGLIRASRYKNNYLIDFFIEKGGKYPEREEYSDDEEYIESSDDEGYNT